MSDRAKTIPPQGAAGGPSRDEQQAEMQRRLTERMARVRHKIVVLSGKGGVGKSTVAANLAVALAQSGRQVGLLDVDIHGPSIPGMMGLGGRPVVGAGELGLMPIEFTENLRVMSIGFLLPRATDAVIWRGPRKFGLIREFLADVQWGDLDFLVVDSPPGTGDEPLAVCQLVVGEMPGESPTTPENRGAVIVTTPQGVAVSDVRRCITFCRQIGIPVLGVIENMSGLTCPHCGEMIDLFKRGGGVEMAS
ncbi:Mrp/NBP35 family ATP-binding protein, partial [Candidatus Sumerlaeota bacterium]|nr:Mrp/NBP35 family ATP-binding protein [Candidatus Sumerlaeota bacterium]